MDKKFLYIFSKSSLLVFFLILMPFYTLLCQTVTISGTVNIYTPVTAIDTLLCPNKVVVGSSVGFSIGDSVLIIQMKGADFDSSNTSTFGAVNSLSGAGNYEIAKITLVNSNTISLNGKLLNQYYVNGLVQLIRIPQYINANVTSSLTCQPWNGSTGGVLILSVQNNLQLNADIDVSGRGFRGGTISNNPDGGCGSGSPLYFYPLTQAGPSWASGGAQKGEGIGIVSVAKQAGRGPLVNGGGGGNKHNTGGAGGSNYTAGGRGGDGLAGCTHTTGGVGGVSLSTYYLNNKIFLGGGGGCGDYNNGVGSNGENGGGIIIITAASISGNNNFIKANGKSVIPNGGGALDGAGGGGGGGAIFVKTNAISSTFTIQANGGNGGNQSTGGGCVGCGGGAGTGAILTNLASFAPSSPFLIAGGAGIHLNGSCINTSYGATSGTVNAIGPLFNKSLMYTSTNNNVNLTASSNQTLLCSSNTVALSVSGASSYTWQPGGITGSSITVAPLVTTVYTISGTFINGCTSSVSITQSVVPTPTLSGVFTQSVSCNGQAGTLSVSGALNYTWLPVNVTGSLISVSPASSTTYTVLGLSSSGCTASATASVLVPPSLSLNISASSASACVGNSITLTALNSGGTPGYSYSWSGGPATNTFVVSSAIGGTFTKTVTSLDINNCSATKTIAVNFVVLGTLTSSSISICPNTVGTLTVSGASTYTWNPSGFVGNTFTVNTGVPLTYTITGTAANGCITNPKTTSISIKPQPILSFITASITCAHLGQATVSASGGLGPFSYTWTPTAQTGFTANGLPPGNYTVSVLDAGTGCVFTPTTTFNSLIPLTGTVSASNSITCNGIGTGTASIVLAGGSGTQNYVWTDALGTQTLANASGLAAGINTVNVIDALTFCSVTRTFQITQPPALSLSIAASTPSVCLGGSITFTSANSGGIAPYTYTWMSSGSPNTNTLSVSEAGSGTYTYVVNSSDANNCFSTKSISVNFVPNPTVSVADVSICPLAIGTLTATGATTYTWNTNFMGPIFAASPSLNTQYSVVGSALSCSAMATASILLKPVPTVTALSNNSINTATCNGQSLSFTALGNGLSFLWTGPLGFNQSVQNPSISIVAPNYSGNYTLKVTAANGCTNQAFTNVTVNPTPVLSVLGSTLCQGQTLNLTAYSSAGASYSWAGPNSFSAAVQNPSIAAATTIMTGAYNLTVTSIANCSNTGVANVSVVALPSVTISSNNPVCLGATLSFSATGGNSYVWYGPHGFYSSAQNTLIANASLLASGIYTLISTSGPCVLTLTSSLTVNPLPLATIVNNSPVCQKSTIQLTAGGGIVYAWSGPMTYSSNAQTATISAATFSNAGTYSLTVTDVNACKASTTTVVSVLAIPNPTVSADSACVGQSAALHASGGVGYVWTGPAGFTSTLSNPVIPVLSGALAGNYTVMVVGLNGCWVDTVVSLKANAFAIPVPTINTLPKACINSKITLSGLGGDVYLWQGPSNFSSTSQQVSFTANNYNVSGIYTLSVKNNSNCVGSATALVNVYAQPKAILLSSKNNLCIPFCSEFKPNTSGNVAPIVSQTFQINNQAFADSSLRYCFNQAGTFTIHLVVKDTNACTNVSSLLVNAYTKPEADFEFYPQNPLAGSEQVLFTNNSTGAAQSQWTWLFMKTKTDTIKTPQCEYLFKEPGKYPVALIVKNTWGCTDTIVKMIRVDEDFNLFVPNAFSPNGDGLNDTFQPKGTAIIQYQLSIYNRWGETLFSTSDFFTGWDGTFKGKDAKDDTYTWKIDIQNNFQIHKTYTGKVNLIR